MPGGGGGGHFHWRPYQIAREELHRKPRRPPYNHPFSGWFSMVGKWLLMIAEQFWSARGFRCSINNHRQPNKAIQNQKKSGVGAERAEREKGVKNAKNYEVTPKGIQIAMIRNFGCRPLGDRSANSRRSVGKHGKGR